MEKTPHIKLANSLRIKTPEETLSLLQPLLTQYGITRVADITALDRIGIPVMQAFRPQSNYPVTVFAGKGLSAVECKVSALMEALESAAAEGFTPPILSSTYIELKKKVNAIDPSQLILPNHIDVESTKFDWVETRRLEISDDHIHLGETWLIPKEAILMPCPQRIYPTSTNGIASGNSLEEAILHGLLEVIERDSISLALASMKAKKVAPALLEHPKIAETLKKIKDAGLRFYIKDVTSDLKIPSFYCMIIDPSTTSPWFMSAGSGAHLDPLIALNRAITEAVQSRVSMIAGSREDLRGERLKEVIAPQEFKRIFHYWMSDPPTPEEGDGPYLSETGELETGLSRLIEHLNQSGLTPYCTVLLSPQTIDQPPLYVVRVVVPNLECFSVDKSRIGRRLIKVQPQLSQMVNKNFIEN